MPKPAKAPLGRQNRSRSRSAIWRPASRPLAVSSRPERLRCSLPCRSSALPPVRTHQKDVSVGSAQRSAVGAQEGNLVPNRGPGGAEIPFGGGREALNAAFPDFGDIDVVISAVEAIPREG